MTAAGRTTTLPEARTPTIVVAAGGTGGHVVPSLAVSELLRDDGFEVVYLGTARGVEARMVPAAGFELRVTDVRPAPRRVSLQALTAGGALARATRAAVRLVDERRAVAALTFGGYVSGPLAAAARWRRLPLVIHEQNAVPGLANRLGARIATRVAVSYPATVEMLGGPPRVRLTGNPVRRALTMADPGRRREAENAFGLAADRVTVLAFGGSLGARTLNRALVDALGRWAEPDRVQILHASGERTAAETEDAYTAALDRLRREGRSAPHTVRKAFLDRMDLAYAAADIVVARSGATTVAELTALGLPSVLVPYPHGHADEQAANARAAREAGAALVVADEELDGARLVALLEPLVADAARRAQMAAAARRLGRPDAARAVVDLVREAAGLGCSRAAA